MLVEKKEWDSDFFGISVGAIELSLNNEIKITEIRKAVAGEFDIVYIMSKDPIKVDANIFTDCKVEFKHLLPPINENTRSIILPYDGITNFELLLSLAWQSGEYSRFKLDSNFGIVNFKKLYEVWLAKSIDKKIADEVFVAHDINGVVIGFMTLAIKDFYCEIGLLAVDKSARGKGTGKDLIQAAKLFALQNEVKEIRVATQECNLVAMNFYQSCGFEIFKRTYIGHYWPQKHL